MKKLNEQILADIKAGNEIDYTLLRGHISTPTMLDKTTKIYDKNGELFKEELNYNSFIGRLTTVSIDNQLSRGNMENKSIVGTDFYDNCKSALRQIDQNEFTYHNTRISGFNWVEGGKSFAVQLKGDRQINTTKRQLNKVMSTSILPNFTNPRLAYLFDKAPIVDDTDEDFAFIAYDDEAIDGFGRV